MGYSLWHPCHFLSPPCFHCHCDSLNSYSFSEQLWEASGGYPASWPWSCHANHLEAGGDTATHPHPINIPSDFPLPVVSEVGVSTQKWIRRSERETLCLSFIFNLAGSWSHSTGVLIRRGDQDTDTEGWPREDSGRGRPSTRPGESPALHTPGSQMPASRRDINVYCLRPQPSETKIPADFLYRVTPPSV